MRRLGCAVLLIVAAVGCGGPHKGDTYLIADKVELFQDEDVFKDARDTVEAGGEPDLLHAAAEKQLVFIGPSVKVRVVEPVQGGAKVVVLGGERENALGWVLSKEIPDSAKQ